MAILVITEKPSASRKIASALGGGKERLVKGKVPYFEFTKDGKTVQVAAAVGHVYSLKQKTPGSGYPVFDIEWVPLYEVDKKADYTKAYLKVLSQLAKNADEVVNACDYDSEGAVIGKKIIEFNAPNKKQSRMKFSTLTTKELQEAFVQRGALDLAQALAGEARHELDWLWGINTSRALMQAIKKAGIFSILSIGRVQGPTLAVLAQREKEIAAFKPQPYWQLFALVRSAVFEHVHGKFWVEQESDKALANSSKQGTVKSVESKKVKQRPPPPFDLTTLQIEAYKCFKIQPTQTLQLAQQLYEASLVSYPRSSSQKLPEKLGLQGIILQLQKQPAYAKFADSLAREKRFRPCEGEKDDPAHPALHPTGEIPSKLSPPQQKMYDLITKRFLACFAPDAKKTRMNVVLTLGKEDYRAEGVRTTEKGWMEFYEPYAKIEETILPAFEEKERVEAEKLEKVKKETQPPKRFTPASIIKALEAKGLGTKATRANIVQTLFDRRYLAGKSIEVTPLGLTVEKALEENVPLILSDEMTKKFESEMEDIEQKKITKEQVVEEGKAALKEILAVFRQKEDAIGSKLVDAVKATQRNDSVLGGCKSCTKSLVVRKSKYGLFVGCLGYPECKTIYPLPKNAVIKPMRSVCEKCGTPVVSVFRKGKKTFRMCLDPRCPTKAHWGNKREQDENNP